MRDLMSRSIPIPALYIKALVSQYFRSEWSLHLVFTKARQVAPCLLVFEDIDSLVTDEIRSYFFNELDGLQSNEGIVIIGSTNNCKQSHKFRATHVKQSTPANYN
jgi:transitional endoplasmic reticulum ATPase